MRKPRYVLLALATSLALILTGCAESKIEKPLSSLAKYENQKLDWATCYESFECTDLLVPVDYADLTIGTFKIAVLRYKAQDQKIELALSSLTPAAPADQVLITPTTPNTFSILTS